MGWFGRRRSPKPLGKGRMTLTATCGLWQSLTVAEVQKLLGPNLVGLKAETGNMFLRDWISRQSQEDLDRLGLGRPHRLPGPGPPRTRWAGVAGWAVLGRVRGRG